ncbi:MAG TPA: hypothetical protein VN408_32425 [Actinoplanes sp.]|nr:hypothetical protein [Actinoplanes sp.]
MICWIHNRSSDVRQVLNYVFGPGDHSPHVDPRVVGAWPMATVGGMRDLQPTRSAGGVSVSRLANLLEQPVAAGFNPPPRPVWHCTVSNDAADPVLPDEQWASIAAEYLAAIRVAPLNDLGAARWVAIRHADDHVHVITTLVRQDGPTIWLHNEYRRCHRMARDLERRLGLRRLGVTDDIHAELAQ